MTRPSFSPPLDAGDLRRHNENHKAGGRRSAAGAMNTLAGTEGAVVAAVRPDSIAADVGLFPGDRLLTLNGRRPRDILEYKWLLAATTVQLRVVRPSGEEFLYDIEKPEEEELGLTFTAPVFDGVRTCRNRCIFCFLDQLPPGLRPCLYLRDDDYRLSFLQGNFITLTNLDAADLGRIERQRLSPLYVSVHAVDPELRGRLLGSPHPEPVLDLLAHLGRAEITVHAQVVICPGLNDGAALADTVERLAALWPAVASVGLVPVGLTRHRENLFPLNPVTPGLAEELVRKVGAWQRRFRKEGKGSFVHAADELYLAAGLPLPAAARYDGFPQLENGIGPARLFLDEIRKVRSRLPPKVLGRRRVAVVTGRMAVPLLRPVVQALNGVEGLSCALVPVTNRFFGEQVTAAGLLVGADVLAALKREAKPADLVLVPATALAHDPPVFLDGVGLLELAETLGVPVLPCGPRPASLVAAALSAEEVGR